MGYETYFTMNVSNTHRENGKLVIDTEPIPSIVARDLEDAIDELDTLYGDVSGGFYSGETIKWYEWDDDIRKLSREFPDILFEVSGDGEESDDFWMAYFLNGKMQFCPGTIVYDEFSESALS